MENDVDIFYMTVDFHLETRLALDTVQSLLPHKAAFFVISTSVQE